MSKASLTTSFSSELVPIAAAAKVAKSLSARIKRETRCRLMSATPRSLIDDRGHAASRAALVKLWPMIRQRRVYAGNPEALGAFIAEQALLLTHLIEIRRHRAALS
jgi:hypothetical protein